MNLHREQRKSNGKENEECGKKERASERMSNNVMIHIYFVGFRCEQLRFGIGNFSVYIHCIMIPIGKGASVWIWCDCSCCCWCCLLLLLWLLFLIFVLLPSVSSISGQHANRRQAVKWIVSYTFVRYETRTRSEWRFHRWSKNNNTKNKRPNISNANHTRPDQTKQIKYYLK